MDVCSFNALTQRRCGAGNDLCGLYDDHEGEYDPSGMLALVEALKAINGSLCTLLDSICLTGRKRNAMGLYEEEHLECIQALAEALTINKTLQSLSLKDNLLGPRSASVLAVAVSIAGSRSLQTLNLSENRIGSAGAASMAEALKVSNGSMSSLDLSDNSIDSQGAAAIAQALTVSGLVTLNLSGIPYIC